MSFGRVHPLMLAGGDPCEGYQIGHSVRFNSADGAYLTRTPSVTGDQRTWTFRIGLKRGNLTATQGIFEADDAGSSSNTSLRFSATGDITFQINTGTANLLWSSAALFRDPTAHYDIVLACDVTQASASAAVKLQVNGVDVPLTYTASSGAYAQNMLTHVNKAGVPHYIGRYVSASPLDALISEPILIDGLALDASAFGFVCPSTDQWRPKKYTGAYGTNGFHLDFSDGSAATAAALGADRSGNGNNWTPVNISVAAGAGNDWLEDTPSNNFATLNPLDVSLGTSSTIAITNGALDVALASGVNASIVRATFVIPSSGRWYFEATCNAVGSIPASSGVHAGSAGYRANATSDGSSPYGTAYTTGDVIGCGIDSAAQEVEFFKNGVSQGVVTGVNLELAGGIRINVGGSPSASFSLNFGQRPFAYTPPAGFKSLCTKNLPTPPIPNPKKHFDAALWAGNGASQDIVLSFPPALTWIKNRSLAATSHQIYDTVRGAAKFLNSDTTGAEVAFAQGLTSFNNDGFSVGNHAGVNGSGNALVAWNWRKGALPGFDIQPILFPPSGPWTLAHSLGVPPGLVIVKSISSGTQQWIVYHTAAGNTGFLALNKTDAFAANATVWNNTSPSSSVVTMGSGFTSGTYGANGIAYLFAEVPGFSKFGSYVGNGLADGTFVYLGFRPAFVMIKRVDSTGAWIVHDSQRPPYNVSNDLLIPNTSGTEASFTDDAIDFVSNGFKRRGTGVNGNNISGGTYIYMAFAEAPQKYANGR